MWQHPLEQVTHAHTHIHTLTFMSEDGFRAANGWVWLHSTAIVRAAGLGSRSIAAEKDRSPEREEAVAQLELAKRKREWKEARRSQQQGTATKFALACMYDFSVLTTTNK